MAISEAKLQELAQIEPPRYLERIADFLSDLTLRSSALAIFEQQQRGAPIGSVGLASQSFGQSITAHTSILKPQRSLDWLYQMLRPYQVGPYELREFTMWLVKWHTKLSETEVIRGDLVPQAPFVAGAPVTRRELREIEETLIVEERRRTRTLTRVTAAGGSGLLLGAGHHAPVGVAAADSMIDEIEVLPPGRRRVQVVRRRAAGPSDQPSVEIVELEPVSPRQPTPAGAGAGYSSATGSRAGREPDVLTRAWRAGHRAEGSGAPGAVNAAGASPETALAPSSARGIASRALWTSNLAMAGAAAGFIYGRSGAPLSLVAQIAAPATFGMAGPATLAQLAAPSFGYPLSHPPISTASWLGAAPPAPGPAEFVAMRPPAVSIGETPTMPSQDQMPTMPGPSPATAWMAVRPGPTAVGAHRQALQEAFVSPGEPAPVAVIMPDGTVRQVPSHPSSAPSRRPLPIPGLLAAGLAGMLLARLLSRGSHGGTALPGINVEPVPSTSRTQLARITARGLPGAVLGTLVLPQRGAMSPMDAAALVGVGIPMIGSGPGVEVAGVDGRQPLPMSRDILGSPGTQQAARPGVVTWAGGPLRPIAPPMDQRLGEVTVVAPPMLVASAQSERKGAAVAFDWPVLAKGAGELDATGLARLREALPQGAQAIYPALPKGSLPQGAVNLRLAPSLLKPLLTQAYGSQAAGIAGSAAATASAASTLAPANLPALGRLVPAARPAGSVAGIVDDQPGAPPGSAGVGALAEAGAGQARRTPMLDFLGLPVRLAPSLGGRAELRDELTARSAAEPGGSPQVVRPNVFGPLRQRLFPGLQTVHAEPDKPAWRRAAPHFGMRDAEPATVLAPDSRLGRLSASSPLPQGGGLMGLGTGSLGMLRSDGRSEAGRLKPASRQTDGSAWLGSPSPGASYQGMEVATPSAMAGGPAGWPAERDTSAPLEAGETSGGGRRPPRALGTSFPIADFARPFAEPETGFDEGQLARGPWRPAGFRTHAAPEAGRRWSAPFSRHSGAPEAVSGRVKADLPDLPYPQAGWGSALPGGQPSGQGLGLSLAGSGIGSLFGAAPMPRDGLGASMPPFVIAAPTTLFSGVSGILRPPAHQAHPLPRLPGLGIGLPSLPRPASLPASGPSLQSGIGDRLGLAALRSASVPPGALHSVIYTPPQVVPMPIVSPAPMPILAQVGGAEQQARPGQAGAPSVWPAAAPPVQQAGPLALTLPLTALPYEAPEAAWPGPSALPRPHFAPRPSGMGSPSLSLPSGLATPSWTPPARTSSTLVQRAPARLYAGVDSGPASRNLMLQRSAAMGRGAAGGPHMPRPSAHRAERITADTQRASVLAAREDGMTANEVHLLANDVWSILRRRLALEADRRGRW